MRHDTVVDFLPKRQPGMRPMLLVVDDEASVRELLRRVFTGRGFDVHAVDNGPQAIKLATILRFDAAVIDLAMPLMTSGLNLLSWFRSHRSYAALPVLILTGQVGLDPDVEASIRRDHAYVFYKGHSLKALVEHVMRLTAPVGDLLPSAA